jgi:hypothetical protein
MSLIPGWIEYCDAQTEQEKVYIEFGQLIHSDQIAGAIEIGQGLFEILISKYPENANVQNLHKRLEVAKDLTVLITQGFKSNPRKALLDIANLGILPEFPSIKVKEKYADLLPPAAQLYLVNLPTFSQELAIQEVLATESKFLHEYYDLKMQSYIRAIANTISYVMITNPKLSGLSYYSFVLPLLYLSEDAPEWNNPKYLLDLKNICNLDDVSDFCLLQVERPNTAVAIATLKARYTGKNFSLVDWSLLASNKCVKNHRPDLAERLLQAAIVDIKNDNKIVELRLKIAENYGIYGDNAKAAKKTRQIAEDFPNSPLYGKIMYSYFAYLARESKVWLILTEIDQALEKSQCQRYLLQLMYLKWWALHKTNQQVLANEIGEQLIEYYGNNQYIAPVMLACATDALSNQHYERCKRLLSQLTKKFSHTNAAKQAQEILSLLCNNGF